MFNIVALVEADHLDENASSATDMFRSLTSLAQYLEPWYIHENYIIIDSKGYFYKIIIEQKKLMLKKDNKTTNSKMFVILLRGWIRAMQQSKKRLKHSDLLALNDVSLVLTVNENPELIGI